MSTIDSGVAGAIPGQDQAKTVREARDPLDPRTARSTQVPELSEWVERAIKAEQQVTQLKADLKKSSDSGISDDLLAKVGNGDLDAFMAVCEKAGISKEWAEEAARNVWQHYGNDGDSYVDGDEDEEEDDPVADWESQKAPKRVGYENLDPKIQRLVLKQEWDRIQGIVKNYIDKDETIRYYMEKGSDKQRTALSKTIERTVQRELRGRTDFGDGKEILGIVLPEIKEFVEAFPINTGPNALGLGPAPGGDGRIAPAKKPDRPSGVSTGSSGEYADNLMQRIEFEMVKENQ